MKDNKIKLFTEILAIVAIVLISFVGVYIQKENRMENQVKEYQYSKDLDGYREVVLEVASEENSSEDKSEDNEADAEAQEENTEAENKEENKQSEEPKEKVSQNNYENYIKAKKIVEKRLELFGTQDYTISQNAENGSIYLQLPENSETDHLLSNLLQIGKFEIKDSEDNSKIFIDNDMLKKTSAGYNTSTEGTTVVLKFEFNKDGKKILKEMSTGEYKTNQEANKTENDNQEDTQAENAVEAEVKTESSDDVEVNTSSEDNKSEEEEKKDNQKKIKITIDDSEVITSSFDDPVVNGQIDLSMSKATKDTNSIKNTLKSVSTISSVLNSGIMPLKYEIKQNAYVQTDINQNQINKVYITLGLILVVALIVLILRYKVKGLIAVIANIGFLALYLLIIRYTNVIVSLESIITGTIVVAINYLLVSDFLKMQNDSKLINVFKSQMLKVLPLILVAVILSFMKVTKLSTCGMFLFWGILISLIYNYILTRDMIFRKEVNIDEK